MEHVSLVKRGRKYDGRLLLPPLQVFGLLVQAAAGMVFWSYLLFFVFFSRFEVLVMKDMSS